MDNDCNKRGQTSRAVIGTEIQTSCNLKANLRYRYYLWVLAAVSTTTWFWIPQITLWYGIMGIPLCLRISIFSYTTIFPTLLKFTAMFNNRTKQINWTLRHTKGQSPLQYDCNWRWSLVIFPMYPMVKWILWWPIVDYLHLFKLRSDLCSHISFLKLVIEPDSLLLEDRRSQTSSERYN